MRTHRDSCCMAETKHAAALSNLAVPPQKSAALFAARLRIARSETPGWRMLCSSPASFAGRLDLISDGKGNSAVRLEAGRDFRNNIHPGLHDRAIFNHAATSAALLWKERTLF